MVYVFGDCELDVQRRVLYRAGRMIRLRRKVFQALTHLLTSRGRAVSKEELCQAVWSQLFISDAALESTIRAVRRAIGESGRAPALIQTVHGYGYRFVAAVEERSDTRADPAGEHVVSPPITEAGLPLPQDQSTSGGSTVVEHEAQGTGWEGLRPAPTQSRQQKPVVVLAINLTFPRPTGFGPVSDEPWTVVSRWTQAVVEKVQGFGGVLMQHSPSLLMVAFGIPHALDQMPHRAVQAALAIQILVAEARSVRGEEPCPEVRMAVHLGAVQIDAQADNPMDRLLAVGDTLSSPIQPLGYAVSGELLVSPQIGRLVDGQFAPLAREVPPGAGQADQVGTYSVVGLTRRRSPSAGLGELPRSRFVGRVHELATLHQRLDQVERGQGLEGHCLSYGRAIPYTPILEILRENCGITGARGRKAMRYAAAPAWRVCGMSRASRERPTGCWRRYMTGSPKGSIPQTSRKPGACLMHCRQRSERRARQTSSGVTAAYLWHLGQSFTIFISL